MRNRCVRALAALALLGFLLPLTACEFREVTLRLADFENNSIEGVRFWRHIEGTDEFEAGGTVHFSEVYWDGGEEWVDYQIVYDNGFEGIGGPTVVQRDPENPELVTLEILYDRLRDNPGWFKVSAFNAAGDSPLSDQEVYL